MNINSIEKFKDSAVLHERLKRRPESAHNRQMAERSVGSTEICEDISGRIMRDDNSAAFSFKGKGFNKFLKSKNLEKILNYIDDNNLPADACVSFVMAGILRPGLTLVVPGVKDFKDKLYSLVHSFSSAILGLLVTVGIMTPVSLAIEKSTKNPENYNNKTFVKLNNRIKELEKNISNSTSKSEIEALTKQKQKLVLIAKNAPEWIICIPRAMLTIALIPPFLKLLDKTGIFKKADKGNTSLKQAQSKNTEKPAFKGKDNQNLSFKAKPLVKGSFMDKLTDWIAKHMVAPVMNSKFITKKAYDWKDNEKIFSHIKVASSFAISATYATRTWQNKKLDSERKKVLSLNQALTWVLSTALSYFVDDKIESWWQRNVCAKFIGAKVPGQENFAQEYKNVQKLKIADMKKLTGDARKEAKKVISKFTAQSFAQDKGIKLSPEMGKMLNGIALFKKMFILAAIFRLLVPVSVTPIASQLGNKAIEKKKAKNEAQEVKMAA